MVRFCMPAAFVAPLIATRTRYPAAVYLGAGEIETAAPGLRERSGRRRVGVRHAGSADCLGQQFRKETLTFLSPHQRVLREPETFKITARHDCIQATLTS